MGSKKPETYSSLLSLAKEVEKKPKPPKKVNPNMTTKVATLGKGNKRSRSPSPKQDKRNKSTILAVPKGEEKFIDWDIPDRQFGDLYCKPCDSHMNSEQMWEAHISGKRHLKNVKKGDPADLKYVYVDEDPTIIEKLNAETRPIVGLQHVVEIQRFEQRPIYQCFLCSGNVPTAEQLIEHMVGTKHRLAYLKEHDPERHKLIHQSSLKKGHLEPVVEECIEKHENTKGRGKMLVKREKRTTSPEPRRSPPRFKKKKDDFNSSRSINKPNRSNDWVRGKNLCSDKSYDDYPDEPSSRSSRGFVSDRESTSYRRSPDLNESYGRPTYSERLLPHLPHPEDEYRDAKLRSESRYEGERYEDSRYENSRYDHSRYTLEEERYVSPRVPIEDEKYDRLRTSLDEDKFGDLRQVLEKKKTLSDPYRNDTFTSATSLDPYHRETLSATKSLDPYRRETSSSTKSFDPYFQETSSSKISLDPYRQETFASAHDSNSVLKGNDVLQNSFSNVLGNSSTPSVSTGDTTISALTGNIPDAYLKLIEAMTPTVFMQLAIFKMNRIEITTDLEIKLLDTLCSICTALSMELKANKLPTNLHEQFKETMVKNGLGISEQFANDFKHMMDMVGQAKANSKTVNSVQSSAQQSNNNWGAQHQPTTLKSSHASMDMTSTSVANQRNAPVFTSQSVDRNSGYSWHQVDTTPAPPTSMFASPSPYIPGLTLTNDSAATTHTSPFDLLARQTKDILGGVKTKTDSYRY